MDPRPDRWKSTWCTQANAKDIETQGHSARAHTHTHTPHKGVRSGWPPPPPGVTQLPQARGAEESSPPHSPRPAPLGGQDTLPPISDTQSEAEVATSPSWAPSPAGSSVLGGRRRDGGAGSLLGFGVRGVPGGEEGSFPVSWPFISGTITSRSARLQSLGLLLI